MKVRGGTPAQPVPARFKEAIESSLNAIAFADLEGRLTYVNASLLRIWGYEHASGVIGRHVSVLAESAPQVHGVIADLLVRGGCVGELPARAQHGAIFVVEASWTTLKDRAGCPVAMMASFTDITERKRADEALRDSEERYRSIVELALDPIFTSDVTGRFLYVNPAAAAQLGTTPDQMIGKSVDDLFPPHVAAGYRAGVEHVIKTGKTLISDDPSVVNGRQVWFSTVVQPVRDRLGQITAAQAIVRDITSRKEAEQALSESEERLRQAVRVADIGIFDHDHVADTLYMSPEQRIIWGLEPDEQLSGLDFRPSGDAPPMLLNLIHPEDRERISAAVERAHQRASDGLYDVQHRLLHRDGGVRWVTMRSQTSFEGEGEARHPVRTVGAVRDVTERKRADEEREELQAQLIQAQKMESVGRLAGGVAHDFNNMLNVIQGYAELVLDQLDPTQPLATPLHEILKAARRSADLTRQLLGFARRQTVVPKVLNLNDVIERSLKMLRRLIGEDITPVWRPAHGLWSVQIDPTQVDQILVNLSANARDAIAGVGQITFRTENVALDAAYCARHSGVVPGDYVLLEVTDNGRGMDSETQAHIFEPFYTTKAEGQGTGLGLATVYGIVQQNQGFITASSEVHRGATVKIFLPRFAGEGARADSQEPARAPKMGTETILLVEDEPMVLRFSKRLLETLGYKVLAAGTPAEAFRLADEQAGRIHLLLTDVVMPEMNGGDLAKRLMLLYPEMACLFVSGYFTDDRTPIGVLDEGVNFLQKPYSMNELAAKVREAIERK